MTQIQSVRPFIGRAQAAAAAAHLKLVKAPPPIFDVIAGKSLTDNRSRETETARRRYPAQIKNLEV